MKKLLGLLLFAGFLPCAVRAQQSYAAMLIPKDLLPYASAVVRYNDESVEIKDLESVIHHVKVVTTILNKNGDVEAGLALYYNKSKSIRYIKGVVYDEFGIVRGKISEKDFTDQNAVDGFSVFIDDHVKHYTPSINNYPYTIEYEYEERLKQTLNLPGWEPNPSTGMAIERSTFKVITKPDFGLKYKEMNLPGQVAISNDNGLKTYTWEAKNMKAVKDEPFSPNHQDFSAAVKLAPEKFMYAGLGGAYSNWNDLGKWIYDKLLLDRDRLPAETAKQILELTAGIPDPKLKAKKIYEYMQQKTRYVSVQVGIGGYQPFTATEVDQSSNGDCKGLVNYTQALLKIAGISSWYCVVESGNRKVNFMPDFATMEQGNHIILCLPFKNDTTWLECTSQKIPFGFLGDFTDDRNVLACTPQGGKLLHTPRYTAQNNVIKRTAAFTIDPSGEITGEMSTAFAGTTYDEHNNVLDEPYAEQVKSLKEIYAIDNMDVLKLDYKQQKNSMPLTTEIIKLKARDYASLNDGKYYFLANPVNRTTKQLKEVRNRQNKVYINRGYTDNDEISYTLPQGYHLEKEPLNITIDKPFGKFTANTRLDGDKLIYKRTFQLNDGTYSKEAYQELVDFYHSIVSADGYNVVLAKNN